MCAPQAMRLEKLHLLLGHFRLQVLESSAKVHSPANYRVLSFLSNEL